jgi:hypothetical protein
MTLLIYYVVLMLIGDGLAVLLGLGIERLWPVASLPIFLAAYFIMLWVAWVLAVHLTEPRRAPAASVDPRGRTVE